MKNQKKRGTNTGAKGSETTATAGETADEAEAQKAARLANYEDLDKRLILLGPGPGQTRLGEARPGDRALVSSAFGFGLRLCVCVCVSAFYECLHTHVFLFISCPFRP